MRKWKRNIELNKKVNQNRAFFTLIQEKCLLQNTISSLANFQVVRVGKMQEQAYQIWDLRHAFMISKVQREFKHNLRPQTLKQMKKKIANGPHAFLFSFIFHNHLLFKTRSNIKWLNIKGWHIYQQKIKQQSSMW